MDVRRGKHGLIDGIRIVGPREVFALRVRREQEVVLGGGGVLDPRFLGKPGFGVYTLPPTPGLGSRLGTSVVDAAIRIVAAVDVFGRPTGAGDVP